MLVAERRLSAAQGEERARLARDSYSYLHLPMVAGIIFVALGVKQTLAHVGDPLGTIPAVALCGGVALYLLGHNAFRLREVGSVSVPRLVVTILCLALIPLAVSVPSLITLTVLACSLRSGRLRDGDLPRVPACAPSTIARACELGMSKRVFFLKSQPRGAIYCFKGCARLAAKMLSGSLVLPRKSFLRLPPSWYWKYQYGPRSRAEPSRRM